MTAFVDLTEHFKTALAKDVAGLLIGDAMGYGTFRAIFDHADDPKLVVKVENGSRCFCNVHEHYIWDRVKDTQWAKWFAPVVNISPSGLVLVMRRTTPARVEELPERVPAFFTDLKPDNWGYLDGRIVCHDYGNHLLVEVGMTKRMRVAKWHVET